MPVEFQNESPQMLGVGNELGQLGRGHVEQDATGDS